MRDKLKKGLDIYTHKLCKKYKPDWIIISFWKDKKVCTRLILIKDFDKYKDVITWRYAEETSAAHYRDETAPIENEDGYSIR